MKNSMDKIIIVNKEKGYTSRDVVNVVGNILGTKKIGHTGTLDPMATGVLVICMGKCLKLCELLQQSDKEYIASVVLGISTDTLDVTGKVLERQKVSGLTRDKVVDALNSFKGNSIQEVPLYSAVKVNGKKLYEYARNGEKVVLPKKEINIKEIELLDFNDTSFSFRCVVSKGTYIRSLIRDIGIKLGFLACMSGLVRTRQGKFRLEDSYTLADIKNGTYDFLTISDVFDNVKQVVLEDKILFKVKNGSVIDNIFGEDVVLFKDSDNKVIALYRVCDDDKSKLKAWKMFL